MAVPFVDKHAAIWYLIGRNSTEQKEDAMPELVSRKNCFITFYREDVKSDYVEYGFGGPCAFNAIARMKSRCRVMHFRGVETENDI